MNRFLFALFGILALATVANTAAGQPIPPVHLPIVSYAALPSPTPFIFQCTNVTEIPQSECQALLAIYNSTNGPGWSNQGGWLTNNTPCSWDVVICQDGHVTGLGLDHNALSGPLPPELGQLANLETLLLNFNALSGPLPPELGQLANLQMFVMRDNQLSGPLPPELGQMADLRVFFLSYNALSGPLPPELGQLAHLSYLNLSNNQISGPLPPELGQMANLGGLVLDHNQLSGPLPPELGQLNLQTLDLASNQLSGALPPELGQLTNLSYLNLSNNQLSGRIPAELRQMANLQTLDLASNQLSGWIPSQLTNLRALNRLFLDYNALTTTDPALLAYLAQKAPGWETTQTVAPTSVQVSALASDRILVTWTPILYTSDGGYYELSYATDPAGPFPVHGVTLDKSSDQYTLTGLAPGTSYLVRLRTTTPVHANNQNELWSDYSSVVVVATHPATHPVYLPLIAQ
jgi:Leucine-rich repeat (LRR) protein